MCAHFLLWAVIVEGETYLTSTRARDVYWAHGQSWHTIQAAHERVRQITVTV